MARLTFILIILGYFGLSIPAGTDPGPIDEMPVGQLLAELGDHSLDSHSPDLGIRNTSVEAGKSIVYAGYGIKANGKKGKRVSRHFECIACHNTVREDPDLLDPDPQARLTYASEHGIPFLQGTTFYGITNRTSFYNGDYEKKYGDLVDRARHNIREAIQVCATECSQGRRLKDWEVESLLMYFETIQIKVGDLDLSDEEKDNVTKALSAHSGRDSAVALIKSKYLDYSPAHFVDPPADRQAGNQLEGDPANGKLIYDLSCMHCHAQKRYSFFALDDQKMTYRFLAHHFPKYSKHSIYQVGRYGTSPLMLKRAYMPNYTIEKMSRQQMEDLRAYIEARAHG